MDTSTCKLSVTLYLDQLVKVIIDNFFRLFSKEDADKCIKYMTDSFIEKGYVDYSKLLKDDKEHPLISYWWKIRTLLKFPKKETWEFLRRYIWNSIDFKLEV